MVGPLVVPDPVLEGGIVVVAAAHVDDEVVVWVRVFEVIGDVLYIVAIGFFQKARGGIGHGDDSVGDIGEVELLSLVGGGVFGPGHDFPDEADHVAIEYITLSHFCE